jgi:uncharacterized protein (TIGR02421 family)
MNAERLRQISDAISEAQRPVRILRALAWGDEVKRDFFAGGARELPRPTYEPPRFDPQQQAARLREIAGALDPSVGAERLLHDTCESYAIAAEMLGAIGTQRFTELSTTLYGRPDSISCDGRTTNLALAQHFDEVLAHYPLFAKPRDEITFSAEEAAPQLEARLATFFGAPGPRVEVVAELTASAVAGADVVKLKRDVRFSDRDIRQLEHHEGHVHVATTRNGRAQPVLPCLGHGAPRTTRTQEGLATFTEFLSQTIDLERVHRLTNRILAIKAAEEGASFLDVFRFFQERGESDDGAFESARRVYRGGVLEGGAPFTKDVCYLDGFVRVTAFLRVALTRGRADLVELLFVGKLDLADLEALAELRTAGLLEPAKFMPVWARDLPFLTAYMAWSSFLDQTHLAGSEEVYERVLSR